MSFFLTAVYSHAFAQSKEENGKWPLHIAHPAVFFPRDGA
jgi:hypothetical protein